MTRTTHAGTVDPFSGLDDGFLRAIGRLTVMWAKLEAGIDYSNMLIHEELGGKRREWEFPRSLSRKLDYLSAAPKSLPDVRHLQPAIVALVPKIRTASELRHDLVHGLVAERVPVGDRFDARIMRLLREGDLRKPHFVTLGADDVQRAADHVVELVAAIFALSLELADLCDST